MSTALIEQIERMSVLDLVNLKREIEERWDITPVVVSMRPGSGDVSGDWPTPSTAAEEQTEFTVTLDGWGANKIAVIKAIRELISLGLKEAKALVESAPVVVKDDLPKDEAEAAAAKLREAGATVTII